VSAVVVVVVDADEILGWSMMLRCCSLLLYAVLYVFLSQEWCFTIIVMIVVPIMIAVLQDIIEWLVVIAGAIGTMIMMMMMMMMIPVIVYVPPKLNKKNE
jgi:hypothetical protein